MPAPSHVTESISDRKAARELAEARASGNVAPAVDINTNKIINPHNPEFITKRPWYLGNNDEGPSLDHQALDPDVGGDKAFLSMKSADELLKEERRREKEKRKKQQFEVGMWVEALKGNKGAYKICEIVKLGKKDTLFDLKYEDGSIEQKVKFKPKSKKGMFKPRIRMTKSGTRSLKIDTAKYGKEAYDAKRDKYFGYDADSHTKKVEKVFQEREQLRRKLREEQKLKRQQEQAEQQKNGGGGNEEKKQLSDVDSDVDSDVEGSDDDSGDDFAEKEEKLFTTRLARQGGVGGAQMKVTARNLRIREDTAKYLRNLDTNSAYYDPKSRSMRDNPNPEISPEELQFAGDNFARISGDAVQLAETQLFAWDAVDKGVSELHPQANPSQAELMKKKFKSKSAEIQLQKKIKVLDKYGGQEYLDGSGGLAGALEEKKTPSAQASTAEERKIRFGVSTTAQEYSRDGRMIKGQGKKAHKMVPQKSKYEEDVFTNGHNTVWGSFFHIAACSWGYADDHSLVKSSYCTGAVGRKANDEANEMRYGTGLAGSAALAQARGMLKAQSNLNAGCKNAMDPPTSRSKLYGEADQKAQLDRDKVKAAMEKLDREEKEAADKKNKRKYNSMNAETEVTEEEMEAYRMRKEVSSDPMSKISSDEILDYK